MEITSSQIQRIIVLRELRKLRELLQNDLELLGKLIEELDSNDTLGRKLVPATAPQDEQVDAPHPNVTPPTPRVVTEGSP